MKYKIEADDAAGALLQLATLYARDRSERDAISGYQCTVVEPTGVRVTLQRLDEHQLARAVAAAEKAAARRAKRAVRGS